MRASIIITSRNRAADLRETLESFRGLQLPPGLSAELLVVDNASSDGTAEVVKQCKLPKLSVRYSYEPKPGQSNARNSGMSSTSGDVIIFTDDDVRVPPDWVSGMSVPILTGTADALAGGVRLAPHLVREWMSPTHRSLLASTETINRESPERMVGANMSFSRRVLERVRGFDGELGPGALGFMDDSFFSRQLKHAGFNLAGAFETEVEHHLKPDRLMRKSWLERARKQGASGAYLDYHWLHSDIKLPWLKHVWMGFKLWRQRILHRDEVSGDEGAPLWELGIVRDQGYYLQLASECRRAHNYDSLGLVKLR